MPRREPRDPRRDDGAAHVARLVRAAGEREHAALCTEEGAGECAGFDRELLRHARETVGAAAAL